MSETYQKILEFKKKYPWTVAWRLKKHSKIIDKHLNSDEKVIYAFVAQKNEHPFDFVNTNAIVLTDRRIMIATKRILFGYFFTAITPDMFNDITVNRGIIWGNIKIDTIKEVVVLSDIDPRALPEIETEITENMIKEKKKYGLKKSVKE